MSVAADERTTRVGGLAGSVLDRTAPPERLATFRIAVGTFIGIYLLVRIQVFLELADRSPDRFDPVGVTAILDRRLPDVALVALIVVCVGASAATALGWRYRLAAPALAVALLVLTSYRSSWGQLLHFEHLMVLFAAVLAASPAADAWSLDRRRTGEPATDPPTGPSTRYGFPLVVASLVVVVTYVIAGIAKLRYGGWGWADGDTLRNHVASAATRLELFGDEPAPLASFAVEHAGLLTVAAVATLVLELGAPIALVGDRWRNAWVVGTWLMHLGILLTMRIGFPVPLFGLAFVPFFRSEEYVRSAGRLVARHRTPRSPEVP